MLQGIPTEHLLAEISWRARQQLAQRLRAQRETRGLSAAEVARAAGVTKRHLENIETGNFGPSDEVLSRIADLFGCSVAELHGFVPAAAGKAA
jgi:transcriptional regulator with XRE-family HTH domain